MQEAIGSIYSIGAVGSLFGVLIFQNFLQDHPLRGILISSQFLYGASGLLDLILVLRLNLKFGIPDYFFVVIDEAVAHMITRMKWMPLLVLSSKLCPVGIEGTFFAFLVSVDHAGMLSSSWAGAVLLKILKVTRTQFANLWIVILIRSISRILPVGLIFLVPKSDPGPSSLPAKMLKPRKGDDNLVSKNVEMSTRVRRT